MTLVIFSMGDMLLHLYNRISRRSEEYNFTDKVLLGISFLIVPLAIWSLWLPSNQYFLFICIIVACLYWALSFDRLRNVIKGMKDNLCGISTFQITLLLLFIIFSLFFFSWEEYVYDSLFYHHQNIRWNEEFSVVPGLGNLDDRYAFNSNYFLLSAIFSLRFLFGSAIYGLQPFIVTCIGCWVLLRLFKSAYEIKYIIVFVSYILLYWVSTYFLGNTSTDILPNFIVFYLIARIVLNPDYLKKNYLILISIPVFLLTCKLSLFPVCLISFYLLYNIIKGKQYSILTFICILSTLIIVPWLIRNVILSGYLIYPLSQIDFFDFDWKIPQEVAIRQKEYIFDIGYYFFRIALRYPHLSIRDTLAVNILTDIIYILAALSFAMAFYTLIKKKKTYTKQTYLLYTIFLLTIVVWATGGPDIRFISGILCAIIFIGTILFLVKKQIYLPSLGKGFVYIFMISIFCWGSSRYYTFDAGLKGSDILYKPLSIRDRIERQGNNLDSWFETYQLNNNITIKLTSDLTYDILPSRPNGHYSIFLPLQCLEARGNTLQEGFRAKSECK